MYYITFNSAIDLLLLSRFIYGMNKDLMKERFIRTHSQGPFGDLYIHVFGPLLAHHILIFKCKKLFNETKIKWYT